MLEEVYLKGKKNFIYNFYKNSIDVKLMVFVLSIGGDDL